MHHEILFLLDLHSAHNYNKLPLKTKSDVDMQIASLRDTYKGNKHMIVLFSTFALRISQILHCFTDEDYDCIVKQKVWAAVYGLISDHE
ncbi:hypothetical protein N7540_002387 [Penicillium herquei]|nr:hypothetical protein N7540_002387 [Penicillium herquei]